MALPVTLFSAVGLPGHHPPFKSSGGDFYALVQGTVSSDIDIYKATDPTDSWIIQDAANNPAAPAQGYGCVTSIQDGDLIHIATRRGSSELVPQYHQFNMATDLWVVTAETIEILDQGPTEPWISIAVRSDGDVVVVYAGDTDQVMGGKKERVDVNIRTGGTWGGAVALDDGGDHHYGNPNVVKGPLTDDMHIVWQETIDTADDPPISWNRTEGRTLDSSNVLSTTINVTTSLSDIHLLGAGNIVSYDDAGTQRIVNNAKGNVVDLASLSATEDGSDDITFVAGDIKAEVFTNEIFANGEVGILTTVELNGDLHVLYSGGGTNGLDQDIYYSTSTDDGIVWSTPTEEIDAISVNFISANIYVRGADTVMAYVYDDGGVQKYNEKVLIAGAVAFLPLLEQKQNTLLRM